MSAPSGLPRQRAPASATTAVGCVVLFLFPFAAVGIVTAVFALAAVGDRDWARAGFLAIFALTFGGVGIGGIVLTLRGRQRLADSLARQAHSPESPWLWREDWAGRRITDSSRTTMWTAWAGAALWNLISLPGAVLATRSAMQGGQRAALLALLFPLVGLGIVIWAVRATLRYRRYGSSSLELTTLPAVVGHTLEGTIRTPPGLEPAGGFREALSCIRRETTGSGRDRTTWDNVLWQEERRVPSTATGLPVSFAIPHDAVPCDPATSGDRVFWRLDVTGEVPGVDYAAAFEVPVFRTAASDAPLTEADRAAEVAAAVPTDYRQPAGSRIRVTPTARGLEIDFPSARNPGFALGLTAFLLIWIGATALLVGFKAPVIFPIFFGAFSMLFALIVMDAWLGVSRVTAARDAVTVATGWVTPQREQTVRAADVAEVTTRITAQAGMTPYYEIRIVTTGGKQLSAGGGIRDKHEAEWLAAKLKAAISK
ncbi:MAG: hypothetical protein ACTHM9_14860 [Gemmatimonadales bacterium]